MEEISMEKARAGSSHTVHLRQVACCDPCLTKVQSRRKYVFTDQIDQLIREIYLNHRDAKTRPGIRLLAKKVGMPHWALKKRARELGSGANQRAAMERGGVRRFWPGMRG